jgi:hypothetical protein
MRLLHAIVDEIGGGAVALAVAYASQ